MSKSSFVAAGDLFITRKLPEKGYEGMQELVDFVEKQDIRFVNLEVTVHDREGYPFGFSGGNRTKHLVNDPEYQFVKEGINSHWFATGYAQPIFGNVANNSSVRIKKVRG